MVKKRFISAFLLCVFTILYAHNVIPHHHPDDKAAITLHHDDDHKKDVKHHHGNDHEEEDDDIYNNFLSHAFSFFEHESGYTIIYAVSTVADNAVIFHFDKPDFILPQYVEEIIYKPPIIKTGTRNCFFNNSSYTLSNLYRGPPGIVA